MTKKFTASIISRPSRGENVDGVIVDAISTIKEKTRKLETAPTDYLERKCAFSE